MTQLEPYLVDADPEGRTCVYRLYDAENVLLYVGMTNDPLRRWSTHQARRRPWWPDIVGRSVTWYPTRDQAAKEETRAIRGERPRYNVVDGDAERKMGPTRDPNQTGIDIQLDWVLMRRGMTLTQLSEMVGLHLNSLSRLKNGDISFIRLDTLAKICRALDCTPGDLLVLWDR